MAMISYLTTVGVDQGKIDGDCAQAGREKTIMVYALEHEIMIPRKRLDGQPAGQRVHQPIMITKVFDNASPKLYQALCSGERFSQVKLDFYRIDKTGREEHYFTIELEDAIIVSMKPYIYNCLDPAKESFTHMEDVSFTYRRITWTHEVDGIVCTDDFEEPRA